MFKDVMRELWRFWGETYYINIFVISSQLTALILALANYKRQIERFVFLMYTIACLFLVTAHEYYYNHSFLIGINHDLREIQFEKVQVLFENLEFFAFYLFFYRLFATKNSKYSLAIIYAIFIFTSVWFFIKTETGASLSQVRSISFLISTIEMILLAIPSLVYFYYLFKKQPIFNLLTRPSFWIMTGILFYSAIIIPFFLVAGYVIETSFQIINYGFAVHLFLFGVLFLFLGKAFSLKRPLTQ